MKINPDPLNVVEVRAGEPERKRWRCFYSDARGRCTSKETRSFWNASARIPEFYCEGHYPDVRTFSASGLSVRPAHPHEVGWMLHEHYLDKWPAIATAIIALCREDIPVGCIVFAVPPRETIKRYGGETWELARLWVDDAEPANTESWFIARAVKLVRRLCPTIRFLVSYADPSVGHIGTIYKAANWRYDGATDSERKTPRFDYACDGRHYSRRSHLPPGRPFERVPRVSKPRYVLDLYPVPA